MCSSTWKALTTSKLRSGSPAASSSETTTGRPAGPGHGRGRALGLDALHAPAPAPRGGQQLAGPGADVEPVTAPRGRSRARRSGHAALGDPPQVGLKRGGADVEPEVPRLAEHVPVDVDLGGIGVLGRRHRAARRAALQAFALAQRRSPPASPSRRPGRWAARGPSSRARVVGADRPAASRSTASQPAAVRDHVNSAARCGPAARRRSASAGCVEHPPQAVGDAGGGRRHQHPGARRPPRAARPGRRATTGAPQAIASSAVSPNPSYRLGRQNTSAPAISAASSASVGTPRRTTRPGKPGSSAAAPPPPAPRSRAVGGRAAGHREHVLAGPRRPAASSPRAAPRGSCAGAGRRRTGRTGAPSRHRRGRRARRRRSPPGRSRDRHRAGTTRSALGVDPVTPRSDPRRPAGRRSGRAVPAVRRARSAARCAPGTPG